MGNKIRKCPYCNSNKGFKYTYSITGNGSEIRDFNGNVIDSEREVFDNIDYYDICCINCNAKLDVNRLDL